MLMILFFAKRVEWFTVQERPGRLERRKTRYDLHQK